MTLFMDTMERGIEFGAWAWGLGEVAQRWREPELPQALGHVLWKFSRRYRHGRVLHCLKEPIICK